MNAPRVHISGLHSGPNPSPGVGVARSLRLAFPTAELVGVDYGRASSGIHWPDFDSISLQRPWYEADPKVFCEVVDQVLNSGYLWIPGMDLEAKLLAREMPTRVASRMVLSPSERALQLTGKPCDWAADILGLKRAESLPLAADDEQLHDFCRRQGWRVWAKGPDYEAHSVACWADLVHASSMLRRVWGDALPVGFVEGHIDGNEESIIFAALGGELLGAAAMVKRTTTPEGKTWSGSISDVPPESVARLRALTRELAWTGGGEIEMIRDPEGRLWLMEVNPRFPAWVHAATLAGANLPGSLVAAAIGEWVLSRSLAADVTPGGEFARVVIELPTRAEYPLPRSGRNSARRSGPDKAGRGMEHPSGMPHLSTRVFAGAPTSYEQETPSLAKPPSGLILSGQTTPRFALLPTVLRERMDAAAALSLTCSTDSMAVQIAYSVKTNPHGQALRQARSSGLWAECISVGESNLAREAGFCAREIVFNGPAKCAGPMEHSETTREQAGVVFCDSLEELALRIRESRAADGCGYRVLGVRLRPPLFKSRFGVDVGNPDVFLRLVSLLRFLPKSVDFGVHFHFASSRIGLQSWLRLCESMIEWSEAISIEASRPLRVFDFGGGFSPTDWDTLAPTVAEIAARVSSRIPSARLLLLEPGKALVQPAGVLLTRILEIRGGASERTAIVDACIAEVPDLASHPHRMWHVSAATGEWCVLPSRGSDSVMGRICMEQDILKNATSLPRGACPGDHFVIEDCGAYDMSMSYDFGRGRSGAS